MNVTLSPAGVLCGIPSQTFVDVVPVIFGIHGVLWFLGGPAGTWVGGGSSSWSWHLWSAHLPWFRGQWHLNLIFSGESFCGNNCEAPNLSHYCRALDRYLLVTIPVVWETMASLPGLLGLGKGKWITQSLGVKYWRGGSLLDVGSADSGGHRLGCWVLGSKCGDRLLKEWVSESK